MKSTISLSNHFFSSFIHTQINSTFLCSKWSSKNASSKPKENPFIRANVVEQIYVDSKKNKSIKSSSSGNSYVDIMIKTFLFYCKERIKQDAEGQWFDIKVYGSYSIIYLLHQLTCHDSILSAFFYVM